MPYARVIPAIRAPRRLAGFDYAVPEGMTIAVGDLVHIPFRTKTLVGVVMDLFDVLEDPTRAIKPITRLADGLSLSPPSLRLLEAVATRSLSSPASVLHAWIGTLPKRVGEGAAIRRQASLLPTHEVRLRADHWHAPDGVIETARNALGEKKRVLILTPWTETANMLATALSAPALTSDLAAGARYKAWSGFLRGEHRALVATRVGAWLAAEADLVIVDEPENDDHKQDELAPRYDARWMAAEAHRLGTDVVGIGLTPRLGSVIDAAVIPAATPIFTAVEINIADWSKVAGLQGRTLLQIEEVVAADRPVIIIQPIHGDRARLRCQDCGWTAVCTRCGAGPTYAAGRLSCRRCGWQSDALLSCPSCGGARLSRSRPGRETTLRDLATHGLLSTRVVSLGAWNTTSHEAIKNGLVVLTDLSLIAGGAEDIRRRERLLIAFRRLADVCAAAGAQLIVQSDAQLLADAAAWMMPDGCAAALDRELTERTAFALPPAVRLVKVIVRGPSVLAKGVAFTLNTRATDGIRVQGPFEVELLPGSRMPRSVIQIIFPKDATDSAIQSLLEPVLSDNVLVDLDPIAFFE